jgi:hypothetical protein
MPLRKTTKPKLKPIKTIDIEVAIAKYYGVRQHIIVPNISWGFHWMHECDMFIITKAGIATEVEIKISKSDLLADFKKGHDHKDRAGRITYFYYAMPKDLYEKVKDLIPKDAGVLICYRADWDENRIFTKEERKPEKRKDTRKLTPEEQLKIAWLGTMRIWSLKEKIIKLQNDGITKKIRKPSQRKNKTAPSVQW